MKKLVVPLLLVPTIALADPYAIVGVGRYSGDVGFVPILGAGMRIKSWLRAEIDYKQLRGFNAVIPDAIPDPTTFQLYGAGVTPGVACGTWSQQQPCINQSQTITSKTSIIGASIILSPPKSEGGMFVRIGLAYIKDNFSSQYSPQLATTPVNITTKGFRPYIGFGTDIGKFAVEYLQYTPVRYSWDDYNNCIIHESITGLTMSYRF